MKKVLIFGSCVSRDAFEYAEPGQFEILGYYARSSLASLATPPKIDEEILDKIESKFQRKMVEADMAKTFWRILDEAEFDIFVMDFIDERFHLLERHDGSVHTISAEYKKALNGRLVGRQIANTSDEKFIFWVKSFQKMMAKLSTRNCIEKLRINKIFWSNKTDLGVSISGFTLEQIDNGNKLLTRLYSEAEKLLPTSCFIEYPENLLYCDSNHKWGISPFHYNNSFYEMTLHQLKKTDTATILFGSGDQTTEKSKLATQLAKEFQDFSIIKSNVVKQQCLDVIAPVDSSPWFVKLECSGNVWTASIVGHPMAVPVEYAFYLMCGKERVAMRWYTTEPSMCFSKHTTPGNYYAIGFVRTNSKALPEVKKSEIVSKKEVPLYDLLQWRKPIFDHATGNAWPEKDELRDGIYRFSVGKDKLDILVDGIKHFQSDGVVLVCFSGAVTQRASKPAPFFSGIGISAKLGMPVLAIADPSLAPCSSLALGWYAGNEKCPDLPRKIAELLDAFARLYQTRFVIFGGSGGGFATISILKYLHTRSTAVVWNPQTSIARYHTGAVKNYLDLAFPNFRAQQTLSIPDRLKFTGIIHDLIDVCGTQDHSLFYLQNQSDKFHVEHHARPFAAARRAVRVSDTVFEGEEGLTCWFGNWGVGHAVPPSHMILAILAGLASGEDPKKLALQLEKELAYDAPFEL